MSCRVVRVIPAIIGQLRLAEWEGREECNGHEEEEGKASVLGRKRKASWLSECEELKRVNKRKIEGIR